MSCDPISRIDGDGAGGGGEQPAATKPRPVSLSNTETPSVPPPFITFSSVALDNLPYWPSYPGFIIIRFCQYHTPTFTGVPDL